MTNVKKYTVSEAELAKSLARMLSAPRSVRVGLTGGQKRALAAKAKTAGKSTTAA